MRVGDWMHLHCGQRVTEREGRHIGRVEMIEHGAWVWVRWEETNWLSRLPLGDLTRVPYEPTGEINVERKS